MTLPNILSFFRLFISPIFAFLIVSEEPELVRIAVFLFLFGAFTDYVDGWVARRFDTVTPLGKFIDPLADKFLTTAAFIAFVIMGILPLWMVVIVILRDFLTTFLRVFQGKNKVGLKTSYAAKVKTFAQMAFIFYLLILLYFQYSDLTDQSFVFWSEILSSAHIYYVMLAITLLTAWTGIEYLIVHFRNSQKNYALK